MTMKQNEETKTPSEGVIIQATIDIWTENGKSEELDTEIRLRGKFAVSGQSRHEFYKRLGDLIDEYRI